MPGHILGIVVVLQYFVFCWGSTLLFCGIGGALNDEASVKAVALGFVLLVVAVVTITILGNEAQRIASPFSTVLIAAVPGIWTGVRSWKAIERTAAKKNKKRKAIPHD